MPRHIVKRVSWWIERYRIKRRWVTSPTYAVIYDVKSREGRDDGEQYYGYFADEAEARAVFFDYAALFNSGEIHNAHLVTVGSQLIPPIVD